MNMETRQDNHAMSRQDNHDKRVFQVFVCFLFFSVVHSGLLSVIAFLKTKLNYVY